MREWPGAKDDLEHLLVIAKLPLGPDGRCISRPASGL